jgi:hypothetical protein
MLLCCCWRFTSHWVSGCWCLEEEESRADLKWRYDGSLKHQKPHPQQHSVTLQKILIVNVIVLCVLMQWKSRWCSLGIMHNYCCWPNTIEWVAWLLCVWEVPDSLFGFQAKTWNRKWSLTSTCFTVRYSLIILQFCTKQFTPVNLKCRESTWTCNVNSL